MADFIRYDLLVQDALRAVVRKVLTDVAREGLPGDHHFYITFRTDAVGVRLSQRMREKYPSEMTIILQYQFWDLIVSERAFEVGLSFSNIQERLVVPFEAITGFYDPSVQFGLKFEVQEPAPETGANDTAPLSLVRTKEKKDLSTSSLSEMSKKEESSPSSLSFLSLHEKREEEPQEAEDLSLAPASEEGGKIVSIESFRKKT